ncbi:zinc ribbon domain-containing protein [Nonomuraea sp. NPDC050790]|uniref:zinc ribbon domain-containing protein n=1 Tax=Nonomuraea sp. NPDC050790 TaxID=3364371 RepID=UPI003798CF24
MADRHNDRPDRHEEPGPERAHYVRRPESEFPISPEDQQAAMEALARKLGGDTFYGAPVTGNTDGLLHRTLTDQGSADTEGEVGGHLLTGLLTCGGCGTTLTLEPHSQIPRYVCAADGCGAIRVAARLVETEVTIRLLELLDSPQLMGEVLLAALERQGAMDFVEAGPDSMEMWWAEAEPGIRRALVELLADHVTIVPLTDADRVLDVTSRVSVAWRSSVAPRR